MGTEITLSPSQNESRSMARAMRRARQVQLGMLPRAPVMDGLDIHTHYKACEEVGGDFYDFIPLTSHKLGVVVGDVSGHGVDAALLMATTKKTLHIHARRQLSPRETLIVTCEDLAEDLPAQSFVTIFYGILNTRDGKLVFASAGHNPPLLIGPDEIKPIASQGTALGGILLEPLRRTLTEQTIHMKSGQSLLIYTDGLTEMNGPGDEQFGEERVLRAVEGSAGASARELIEAVSAQGEEFRQDTEFADDVTIMALRFLHPARGDSAKANTGRIVLGNLGSATTSFVGRDAEMSELVTLLETPVVTVTGVTGCGKSRLAIEFARANSAKWPGGVWLCDLSECESDADVCNVVGRVLEVPLTPKEDPAAILENALSFRRPLLLLLDGVDRAAPAVARLIARWTSGAPRLRCLATGFGALGLPDERELRLMPLSTPRDADGDVEALASEAGVRMLLDRVKEVQPGFKEDEESVRAAANISRMLEGLPLAIELVAARTRFVPLARIRSQLKSDTQRLRVLSGSSRDTSTRRRSLEDAIRWSLEHLTDAERDAFFQLCFFRGGFWLESAEGVLDLSHVPDAPDALTVLQALLERSLLHADDTPLGTRFRIYGPLRELGIAEMRARHDEGFVGVHKKRLAEWLGKYVIVWRDLYYSRESRESLDRIAIEQDNILDAFAWAEAAGDHQSAAKLCAGLTHYMVMHGGVSWHLPQVESAIRMTPESDVETLLGLFSQKATILIHQGHSREAFELIEHGIKMAEQHDLKASRMALGRLRSYLMAMRMELAPAIEEMERCIAISRELGDRRNLGRCLHDRGRIVRSLGRYDEALENFAEAERIAKEEGALPELARLHHNRAIVLNSIGKRDEALKSYDQAEVMHESIGRRTGLAPVWNNRGVIYRDLGNLEEALACYIKAGELAREVATRGDLPAYINNRARIHFDLGDYESARTHNAEALRIAMECDSREMVSNVLILEAQLDLHDGKFESALRITEEGEKTVSAYGGMVAAAACLGFQSLALLGLGQKDEALARIERAFAVHDGAAEYAQQIMFFMHVVRGVVMAALGKRADAAKAVRSARDLAEAEGFDPYDTNIYVQQAYELLNQPERWKK